MMNFDQAFILLTSPAVEGGYSNDKADPGGKTRYGVTEAEARRIGYTGAMQEFPLDLARKLYQREYWEQVRAEELPAILRYPVFDGAVNSGVGQSIKWLQRAVGAVDDGVFGPMTMAKIEGYDAQRIKVKYLAQRLRFLAGLPTWPAFGRGWANRVALLMEL